MSYQLDWLERWNMYSPAQTALVDGESGQSLSYGELFVRAKKGAAYLQRRFLVQSGDRVAVLATNDLAYVILFFACQRLGATLVPINYRLTATEVDHILDDCEPRLVVFDQAFEAALSNRGEPRIGLSGDSHFSGELLREAGEVKEFAGSEECAAMILYTSGTTGRPKGAVLSHRMLFWNSVNTTMRLNLTQADRAVIFAPLFHTGGWNVLLTPFLHRGAQIILTKKFDADQVLCLSEKYRCTILFGVPTTIEMMGRSTVFDRVDLQSVRYAIVGGEPMPLEEIRRWNAREIPIRQGYGLTEFGPNVFSLNEEHAETKIGSIGFPNFYIEAKVVNRLGTEVADDEIGELILRGPMCMSGYWKNSEATMATMRDGWLFTGDLVKRDCNGFYYVVGRLKDMFISGGENVYPVEVENTIRQLEGVREVAVIGVPDRQWGESGQAFVVPQRTDLSESDILAHCQKHLAKFKIPKKIRFLESLPKGDSGKVIKRNLVELVK